MDGEMMKIKTILKAIGLAKRPRAAITLEVNSGADQSERMQVNVTAQVNSKAIRREQYNGREHIVIPSFTLPFDVVMNGGLYPKDQIVANYKKLDGTLAPLGHPTVNGQFVSAFSPEGINQGHIGAWNRNTKLVGNRVYTEKWVDVEVAQNSEGGRRVLERVAQIEKGEGDPIHTSVAVFLEREPAVNANGYEWVAKIHEMDHDAILLDEPGAATPSQGVGMMVNADRAVPIAANTGALVGETYRERENRIQIAAKAKFAPGPDDYVWIADFTDSQAVLMRGGGAAEVYGYTSEGGRIVFEDAGTPVARQESWVATAVNALKRAFNQQARPATTKEGDMPLTPEEKAELVNEIGKAFGANMATSLKPLSDAIASLQENQKALTETLSANARAAEATKRAEVAAKFGEVVANSLSGEALDAMHKSLGTAAPIGTNAADTKPLVGAPDPATHLKA